MIKYSFWPHILCFLIVAGLSSVVFGRKPSFKSYDIELAYKEILVFDFDGNGLDDIVAIDDPNLIFYFHDPKKGFAKTSDLIYSLENKPAVIWHTKLGNNSGQNILVMTNDGVSALTFVDKTSAPKKKKIINRKTIIPKACHEDAPVIFFTLSAETSKEFPLIFVPTEDALEIWSHNKQWQHEYSLQDIPNTLAWSSGIGYTKMQTLHMNIADFNGDKLDDLIVHNNNKENISLNVYSQTDGGTFPSKPSRSFKQDEWDWRKRTYLQDINGDGKVDIIRNNWLQEPGFIPGADSGKVIVEIFIADHNGEIPEKAQYLFRKGDWTASMPIVDIDNDGHIDLVLGYGHFDTREGIRKAITSKKLDHTLRFHFYQDGEFKQDPDFERKISVHLGYRGPIFSSRQGRVKNRTSLDGDFNGDGLKDLLVKDKADKISVYYFISRTKGFSKRPDIQFNHVGRGQNHAIHDFNKDGISDLVIYNQKKKTYTIFLSKRK